MGVRQNKSVHPQLKSQPSPHENPESQQTLANFRERKGWRPRYSTRASRSVSSAAARRDRRLRRAGRAVRRRHRAGAARTGRQRAGQQGRHGSVSSTARRRRSPSMTSWSRGSATAPEPALREQVAKALVNKGVRLGQLDRARMRSPSTTRWSRGSATAPEPALREQVAKALVNKGVTLGQLDRSEDAIAVYDEWSRRFGDGARAGAARTGRQRAGQQGRQARSARPLAGGDRRLRRSGRRGSATPPSRRCANRSPRRWSTRASGSAARPLRGRDRRLRPSGRPVRRRPRAGAARTGRQSAGQQGRHARQLDRRRMRSPSTTKCSAGSATPPSPRCANRSPTRWSTRASRSAARPPRGGDRRL